MRRAKSCQFWYLRGYVKNNAYRQRNNKGIALSAFFIMNMDQN